MGKIRVILQKCAVTAAIGLSLWSGATADTSYTVKFENGQMIVQGSPDNRGQYQVYSVPVTQVYVQSYQVTTTRPTTTAPYAQTDNTEAFGQGAQVTSQGPTSTDKSQTDSGSAFAQEVLSYTNQARAQYGLAPLKLLAPLNQAATSHSQEMVALHYFSHTSPTPGRGTPTERVQAAGIHPGFVAENIFQCSGYPVEELARLSVDQWLQSPGHRRNILDPRATYIGIATADLDGDTVVTQVFGGDL